MKIKRGDFFILAGLIIITIIFVIIKGIPDDVSEKTHNGKVAKVTINGRLYKTIPLTKEAQEFRIQAGDNDEHFNLLKVHDYGIEMIDADCPDKVCLQFGFITKTSESIVCLPHRLLVQIENADNSTQGDELDAIVH